ncbi:MAG: amidohydrolase [Acidobacteria bacterium]|nr:amidohydrolase [Acidobacteriota bacterium]
MQTQPFGPVRVNDSHCHFFSHVFFKSTGSLKFREGDPARQAIGALGWESPPEDPADLARRWAAELERHGVSRAALIASVPGDEESVAAAVRTFPQTFVGFFMLDPTQPDAVQRARRGLGELKLRCLCLFPAMHGYALGDPRVRAVLDATGETAGCAVFVHCGVLTVGVRKKLGLPSPFDLARGNPLHLTALAPVYPGVNFIIPHLGAGMLQEALVLADVCPNVYLDTSSSNGWVRYLGITLQESFRRALAVTGSQRLLFGTDSSFFPRGWQRNIFDQQLAFLEELQVERPSVEAILGGNFDRLFPPLP